MLYKVDQKVLHKGTVWNIVLVAADDLAYCIDNNATHRCYVPESELSPYYEVPVSASEKPLSARLSLLEPEFLMEMAKVGDFGTRKYAEEDWRDSEFVTVKKRLDSVQRHIGKFASSHFEDQDNETSLSHMAHAAFNCMMIWWICKYRSKRDDRWKGK